MVLNDSPLVASSTREKVQASLARLGYVYDRAAASLRKNQTQAVGMIITRLTNPYFAEFAEGIQAELDARGMDVLLGVSGEDRGRQLRLLRSMEGRRVDGIVLIPAHGTDAADIEAVQVPLLMLARRVPGADIDYVGGDNHKGARSAVEHLVSEHHCERLAFIGGFADSSARIERVGGFLEGIRACGLKVAPNLQPTCAPDRVEAREAATRLLSQHSVDAIVCFNDIVAFGVLDALADRGLVAGQGIRVIGFDDIHDAAFARPALASVAVPAHVAGRQAAELLLARVAGLRTSTESLVLAAELKPRASCGCEPNGEQ
jgi:LacI family transcriptional regulator